VTGAGAGRPGPEDTEHRRDRPVATSVTASLLACVERAAERLALPSIAALHLPVECDDPGILVDIDRRDDLARLNSAGAPR